MSKEIEKRRKHYNIFNGIIIFSTMFILNMFDVNFIAGVLILVVITSLFNIIWSRYYSKQN